MLRTLAILAAFGLIGATATPDPAAAAHYFAGTWSCAGTTWTWRAPSAGSPWLQNVYGDPAHPDGTALVGYVAGLQRFVYRDFHTDGSYADLSSPGPTDGRWEWSGPYYPAGGGAPLNGRITYREVSADRYDRTFESLENGKIVPHGGDRCDRQTPSK